MKNRTIIIVLSLLFLLSLCFRIYRLGIAPESTTWDETALGYNALSLSKTGADEYGNKLPILLRSFDDYKPALYAYLSIPFIRAFGLNIISIRLLSALAGASLVFSLYLLTKNITGNKSAALFSAVIVVTSPLLLLYSRMALEANLSLAFFTFGTALILAKKPKTISYISGLFALALSAYAYHSARYIVPFALIASLLVNPSKDEIIRKVKTWVVLVILFLPILYFILIPKYNTRFSQTSLFTNHQIIFGSFANLGKTPPIPALVSRSYFYLIDFGGRYLGYFNPFELFVKASGHPSYRVEQMGIFNLVEIIFWLIGVGIIIKKAKAYKPLWILLLIAPLPAAMTVDWFIALRASLLWPLMIVVTSLGAAWFFDHLINKKLQTISLLVVLFWLFYAIKSLETVIIYHPYVNAGAYQYGFAQMVPFVKSIETKYNRIIIDSPHAQPYIFFLFYTQFSPSEYQTINQQRQIDFVHHTNYDFGPYVFRKIYFPTDRSTKNTLFVGNTFALPQDQLNNSSDIAFVKDFYYPDGSVSFRVVATKP